MTTALALTILVSSALSQGLAVSQKNADAEAVKENGDQQPNIDYINNVDGKVLRSFHKSFGERPDAKWSKTEKGFAVSFKEANMFTNVFYRHTGSIDYRCLGAGNGCSPFL